VDRLRGGHAAGRSAQLIGLLLLGLAGAGIVYQLAAAVLVGRAFGTGPAAGGAPVTILKPLHGAEPRLHDNLATFLAQDYAGPVQIVCGVQRDDDPAIAVVEALQRDRPDADIALVVDPASHGGNAKVSNLINMLAVAKYDLLVLGDSDMAVGSDYLARVVGALDGSEPRPGAVTCLYRGRGDAGRWSQVAAMGISHGFLPSVTLGMALGLAKPCMGSTIALRRATLDRIGGFEAVADVLADDYAIGAAVRGLGLAVAVPRLVLAHGCVEASFAELARHELRWNATVFRLDPGGFTGLGLLNPLPVALLALVATGFSPAGLGIIGTALLARLVVAVRVDRLVGMASGPLWLLPIRDCISFGLFIATFFGQSVDWRGVRLTVARDGRVRRDRG
jgi:ceramide glucosyltransferase